MLVDGVEVSEDGNWKHNLAIAALRDAQNRLRGAGMLGDKDLVTLALEAMENEI